MRWRLVTVVDAFGREIRAGAMVSRRFLDGSVGPNLGRVSQVGAEVQVNFAPSSTLTFATERVALRRRWCSHLVVASDPDDFDPTQPRDGRSTTE